MPRPPSILLTTAAERHARLAEAEKPKKRPRKNDAKNDAKKALEAAKARAQTALDEVNAKLEQLTNGR